MTYPDDESSKFPSDDDAAGRDSGREFVRALARGLAVIETFEGTPQAMTLSEIAQRAELSRGTVRRVLITLQALGYLSEERGRFALTPRVLRLGYSYLSSQPVWALARPYVEGLSSQTGETVSLAVLDAGMIVYVYRVAAARLMHDGLTIGARLPAYCASMGRVLLAGLSREELERYLSGTELRQLTPYTVTDPERLRAIIALSRETGFAVNDQEMEVGLRSIAVPVTDHDGKAVAALNISCSTARTSHVEMERNLLPPLRAAARAISNLLTHAGVGGRSNAMVRKL
jgi:IclR family transcriptional regulator, pca regulon regulatory protein